MMEADGTALGGQEGTDDLCPDAFVEIYREHVDRVYRYVHRRCRDHSLAEDITQDVFLSAARSVSPPRDWAPWLYSVARNRLVDVVRREDRFATRLRLIAGGADASADIEIAVDVAAAVDVGEALARLRPAHRVVLQLHYVDDLTVDALAAAIGRTPKGAEALLTRARRALRDELEGSDG